MDRDVALGCAGAVVLTLALVWVPSSAGTLVREWGGPWWLQVVAVAAGLVAVGWAWAALLRVLRR